jgi:hypothetical protein
MQKAKIYFIIVLISGAASAAIGSRYQAAPCVLYTQDANGICRVLWPQPVTTLIQGPHRGVVPVTDVPGRPCVVQDVYDCSGK